MIVMSAQSSGFVVGTGRFHLGMFGWSDVNVEGILRKAMGSYVVPDFTVQIVGVA